MDIGRAMAKIRQECEIGRPEMAKLLKITASALWKIETGHSIPKGKTIDRFCDTLHIPLARLYIESLQPEDFIIED